MSRTVVSEHLRENYDGYYSAGDSEWRRLGAIDKVENIVALCNGLPRRKVLEIGAGEGSILRRLSELEFGEDLFGLEISASGVAAIKGKQIPRLAECQLFDGYHVPYEDGAFDIAILSHVVEHVEHPRQLLAEASRVARYLLVEVPLEDTIRLPDDYVQDAVGHINFYSPVTIRRLLQTAGLKVLAQRIGNPSKATYLYQKGVKGLFDFYIKALLLAVAPRLATRLFVYHGALLCQVSHESGQLAP